MQTLHGAPLCRERPQSRCQPRGAILDCQGGDKRWILIRNRIPLHQSFAACPGTADPWPDSRRGQVGTGATPINMWVAMSSCHRFGEAYGACCPVRRRAYKFCKFSWTMLHAQLHRSNADCMHLLACLSVPEQLISSCVQDFAS